MKEEDDKIQNISDGDNLFALAKAEVEIFFILYQYLK